MDEVSVVHAALFLCFSFLNAILLFCFIICSICKAAIWRRRRSATVHRRSKACQLEFNPKLKFWFEQKKIFVKNMRVVLLIFIVTLLAFFVTRIGAWTPDPVDVDRTSYCKGRLGVRESAYRAQFEIVFFFLSFVFRFFGCLLCCHCVLRCVERVIRCRRVAHQR